MSNYDDIYKTKYYHGLNILKKYLSNESEEKIKFIDIYSHYISNYLINLNYLKEGVSNYYYNSNLISINFDLIKQGKSNIYFNYNVYDNLISSNLTSTDIIKQGSINFYYNSNFNIDLNNLITSTDNLKEGKSNIYQTVFNLNNYLITKKYQLNIYHNIMNSIFIHSNSFQSNYPQISCIDIN